MNPHRPKLAALYLRVSTDSQDTDAQRNECAAYALRENLPITATLTDTASGALSWRKRALGQLAHDHAAVTDLLVYDWSRIGRDMVDTLTFLQHANDRGVTLHIVKTATVVRADISGKVLSTVWALAAEIERELLRSRTRAALGERQRKIQEHGHFISKAGNTVTRLGRPKGTTGGSKLEAHRADVIRMRDANVADSAIARVLGVDRRTVARFIATLPPQSSPTKTDA